MLPFKVSFHFQKVKKQGFVFCKKSTILNPQMKILNFYDGVYIGFIYQNMRLNEKIFTWAEGQSVVVFEGVGGLPSDITTTLDEFWKNATIFEEIEDCY